MSAPVRGWVAAVLSVVMAVVGLALAVGVGWWVLDPVPDPADTWVPAPTCQPGPPVVTHG